MDEHMKKARKTLGSKGHHRQKDITQEEGWRVDHSGVLAGREGVNHFIWVVMGRC